MSARHKRRVKVSLTPLGYITLFFVILIAVVVAFVFVVSSFFSGWFSDGSETKSGASNSNTTSGDTTPPVINQTQDIVVYEDTTVSYRGYIQVTDDTDKNPTLLIDSSKVDISTPGTYEVVFTAKDADGNTSNHTATVTVNKKPKDFVDAEVIYEAVDKKLATLINDNMSLRDKAKAIYNWAKYNIPYSNTSDKSDYMMEAYRVLKGNGTDCFGYYAVTKLMLDRIGIPNIDVKKVKNYEGDSNHYWSLISLDGGENYYHFDATPRRAGGQFFMLTDAEMDEYSAKNKNCFNRDKSLYPATPEVPYDKK